MERAQNLLASVGFEILINYMCYHQARRAWFIGHCWGRGWRDATKNLLQTSIINSIGTLPGSRIICRRCLLAIGVRFFKG